MIRVLLVITTVAAMMSGAARHALAQDAGCQSSQPDCALAVPAAAASLSKDTVSAAADSDALITVQSAGRFKLQADSKTGVAIQLIDMVTGPGDKVGDAGVRDGRLDVLLDKGVYKLRVFGATGAAGDAKLSVSPFREAEAKAPTLVAKALLDATMSDLTQRSYWVAVEKPGRISVEAAGRALQDMRLWRNGRDLSELTPAAATIEPKPGHPFTRLRLEGTVEPGVYRVTAYGGEPLPWADGDKSEPFHLRAGEADSLASGFVDGVIGPLGTARFRAPSEMTAFRLELPEPTAAKLSVSRGGSAQGAAIAKNSREPVVTVFQNSGSGPALVDVTGFEGQKFRLRALRPASSLRVDQNGLYQLSVDVAGEGGDELPATVMMARYEVGKPTTVISSSAPRIGPGQAWRRKFNLRAASTLIFELTNPGRIAVTSEGPGLRASIQGLTMANAPRVDGNPRLWDLEAGWYLLRIEPVDGAVGIVDMTIGQPGLKPELAPTAPPRTNIPLGIQPIVRPAYYQVFANTTPGLLIGPKARALPADLGVAPVTMLQTLDQPAPPPPVAPSPKRVENTPAKAAPAKVAPTKAASAKAQPPAVKTAPPPPAPLPKPTVAGQIDLPILAPADGSITAAEIDGTPVPLTLTDDTIIRNQRRATVHIVPSAKPRTVVVSWSPPTVAPKPMTPEPESAATVLEPGKPLFFDLEADARRSFRLNLAEGGLYRIETLGRLKTSATIGSAFVPKIDEASDNGAGHNALLQSYLRAGAYRLNVAASDSSGHLGLIGKPSALLEADAVTAGEAARATLDEGRGAVFPISVTETGNYRLDLFGLGRTFAARMEDAEGWPITTPGELTQLEQRLAAGRYRLVVLPEDVDARAVARLTRLPDDKPLEGHGPHPLPFDATQAFQWREPAEKTGARDPDRWAFSLQGPAHVALDIGDGMIGELLNSDGPAAPLARIVNKRGYSGLLPAGRYIVEARSLGRNDRLDYELTLRADEIQPDTPRRVDLPATIPFAIAGDRVVNLTSFGRTDLRGVLKDGDGRVIERLSGRLNDWNIALSRALPTGAYKLELAAAKAQEAASSDDDNSSSSDDNKNTADADDDKIEVNLALPDTADAPEMKLAGVQTLTGPSVHRLALPAVEANQLLLVAARANSEIVLLLERRSAEGAWLSAGSARGVAPVLALPTDNDAARPWRVSAWSVDGGSAAITVAARAMRPKAQALGAVKLDVMPIEGMATPIRIALVEAPASGLLSLQGAPATLSQGSSLGRVLAAAEDGLVAPQTTALWLVSQDATVEAVKIDAAPAVSSEIALGLAAGDTANLPRPAISEGRLRLWRAEATSAQPGLDAGRGMGVAEGSTIAFAGDAPIMVWNAGSDEALRLRLAAIDVAVKAGALVEGRFAGVLPPMSAQRIALPDGDTQVSLDLSAGVAALLVGGSNTTIWSGLTPVSRQLDGHWTEILLVNTGAKPAPATLTLAPSEHLATLSAGGTLKRFFGAAGSFTLPVEATAGDKLTVVGGNAVFVATAGRVVRGETLALSGAGQVTIEHGPGLVAVWIEGKDKSPWPATAAVAATLPQDIKLEGQAMRFALKQDQPVLLHARSNAPIILMLSQDGKPGTPALFASGAEFHRYLPAGSAELSAFSPHDGPLAGSLQLSATPVQRIGEGLGEPLALAPGQSALFAFDVTRAAEIGVGLRADPDRATVRLLDERGQPLGEGVAQIRKLQPGRYLIEARIPTDSGTTIVRPAVIGIVPPPSGPPPEVTQDYLELVGLGPARAP